MENAAFGSASAEPVAFRYVLPVFRGVQQGMNPLEHIPVKPILSAIDEWGQPSSGKAHGGVTALDSTDAGVGRQGNMLGARQSHVEQVCKEIDDDR